MFDIDVLLWLTTCSTTMEIMTMRWNLLIPSDEALEVFDMMGVHENNDGVEVDKYRK